MMNITCNICSELLQPSDDAFVTPCGHVFHFPCITQWLLRSKTCPQCRERVTQSKIHRVYFSISNNDTIHENPTALQSRIESLEFQILLKDKDIKDFSAKIVTLEKQTSGLRQEVRKLEGEIDQKRAAVHGLKEQMNYFKKESFNVDPLKRQVNLLKKELADLKDLKTLLLSSQSEVNKMLRDEKDSASLATYVAVLKKELSISTNKRKELRNTKISLEKEIAKLIAEREKYVNQHSKLTHLEEELARCKSRNMELEKKLERLAKRSHGEAVSVENKIQKTDNNSTIYHTIEGSSPLDESIIIDSSFEGKSTGDKGSIPKLTSRNVNNLKTHHRSNHFPSASTGLSILAKRTTSRHPTVNLKMIPEDIAYDGFGGHSKSDDFPNPVSSSRSKQSTENAKPLKRQKLDDGNNRKLDKFVDSLI